MLKFLNGNGKPLNQYYDQLHPVSSISAVLPSSGDNPAVGEAKPKATPELHNQRETSPQHKGSPEQQRVVDYAWEISHDMNFLYLLKAENGTFEINRLSKVVGSNGYRDIGLCQINKGFHPKIVKDARFSDYKWQLEQCYSLYKGGTTFYGLIKFKKNAAFAAKIKSSFN